MPTTPPPLDLPIGPVTEFIDGGGMECGSGLLLLLTRAMRRLQPGARLGLRSTEPSVGPDLAVWSDLVGHPISATASESPAGPWWFAIEKAAAAPRAAERGGDSPGEAAFSSGDRTPIGQRLWVYTNFDCNLACSYCCAQSSPRAPQRRMPVETTRELMTQLREIGGQEVYFSGGEPFMHPDLLALVEAAEGFARTILTNAMIFGRGARHETLRSLERDVTLQVSLDSATPEIHDRQRGLGSWSRAVDGIALARSLGFRVRVAATVHPQEADSVAALQARLDADGIPAVDRLIRPIAHEGFADTGVHVSIDTLEPEPTVTADGAWWHPVAVTNPNLRVAAAPLPLAEVFAVVRDTVAVQDAAARSGREVFRCA